MALRQQSVEREARGYRVLGVANELAVLLRKTARLAHEQRMGIDNIEKIAAGVIKVDFVGRDERAEGFPMGLQKRARVPIGFGGSVKRKIDPLDHGVLETEAFRPPREDLHDRTLRCG